MSTFKIEKGIAPKSKSNKYPFDQMEIGDSFVISKNERPKASMSAYQHGYRTGTKYSCRLDDKGDLRVFRIK